MGSVRNRERKTKMVICGVEHICPELAAKFIGCSKSKLSDMIAKTKKGILKLALKWYRDTPRSPMWFDPAELESFMLKRTEMHV